MKNLNIMNNQLGRRQFLSSSGNAIGAMALASLLQDDGVCHAENDRSADPLAPKPSHFPGKAKSCIFIFLAGGPSQIDMFDPKPKLSEMDGKALPDELLESVRFAFIKKESARLIGSPRKFEKHGECGMEISDLMPHLATCADDIALVRSMHTDQFNHHPAQILMNTGVGFFGRPTIGSWLNYGLGNPAENLPGYVVLTAGRGTSGGASLWSSGFLPSTYAGVLFRSGNEPVLNLSNPQGISSEMQEAGLNAIRQLNQNQFERTGDSEIASRIASYELAFRMQSKAPELVDVSSETEKTLEAYGVNRTEPEAKSDGRGNQGGANAAFGRNCLLARRLVERGVRFVNLYHASWDHHSNLDSGLGYNCGVIDQPIAALIKDLKERSLLDSTLIVLAGEFGRTPLGENRANFAKVSGRDHHPYAFSIMLAGGGVKGGTVVGRTDELGWAPVEDPVHINDLHATMLHTFGMDHKKLVFPFGGLPIRLTNVGGNVVQKLLT